MTTTGFLAITGGTIIDGCGGVPIKDGVLVIEGHRITAVGDALTPVPTQAARIDARGKFLIPGLMDASVHLVGDTAPATLVKYEGRYDELAVEAAQLALKGGLTTIFDTWGPRDPLIKARDAINGGREIGARVYLSGNMLGYGGPYSDDFYPDLKAGLYGYANEVNAMWEEGVGPDLLLMTAEQFRLAIRRYVQSGVDFLRYAMNPLHPARPPHIVFSPRMQSIIVEEGHRAGITVQTGGRSLEGKQLALDAGVDLIQRPDITGSNQVMPQDALDELVRRRMPCGLALMPDDAQAWMSSRGQWLEIAERNQRALLRAGVMTLLTTDGGVLSSNTRAAQVGDFTPPPPYDSMLYDLGSAHWNWLLAAEQRGMKPMEALLSATRNIAQAYKVDKDLGTLEAGKVADLIILEKNPLDAAANYRSIAEVIKEGTLIDRNVLPTTRLLVAT